MRKILLALLFIVLFSSLASAEIIVEQQPLEIYNLGDTVAVPITIKALSDISGSFNMDLLCAGNEINFYKNGISLAYGEEIKLAPSPSLVLTTDIIGATKGKCKIRATLGSNTVLTNEFSISNLLTVSVTDKQTNIGPGKSFLIEGEAIKQNRKAVEGFVEIKLIINLGVNNTDTLSYMGSVNNGFFSVNIAVPENAKAGNHLIGLDVYEKDLNAQITNKGSASYDIYIAQIPTSLEIYLENSEIEPGKNLEVKAILHDQTGEKIESDAIITIKNEKNKVLEQTTKRTDEIFTYNVPYNQPPLEWTIIAESNDLISELKINITEKLEVNVFLINKTIAVTNMGNVPYCNQTILVKIGQDSINLEPCLDVDETKKYLLTAPDGEYEIEVIHEGENIISQSLSLTGNAIGAKESTSFLKSVRSPAVWIFLILILGIVGIIIFKKGYKRSFIGGYINKNKSNNQKSSLVALEKKSVSTKHSFLQIPNPAELSLSISGNKQDASVICLNMKNYKEYDDGKGNIAETLQKIVHLSDNSKATIYQNSDNLFFIFAPLKTKTFKNEKLALKLAQKITDALNAHNKIFKQKIDYGVGLHYGEIIAKEENKMLQFMPMKTLMSATKKIASFSKGEVLMSEEISSRFGGEVKTQKHTHSGTNVYEVKELIDRSEHAAFISNFLHKLENDKKK